MKTPLLLALIGWFAVADLPAAAATNLFQVLRTGDSAAVRQWLKSGASVNERDALGNSPLMVAAATADVGMLRLLLAAGAEVNVTNQAGATPLMRAATFEDKVRLLVARGADVGARSRFGNTALILAARKPGNSRTVRLLLERGADPNATNVLGATPLMAAAAAGDLDSVRLLLDQGADVNARPDMSPDGFVWGGGRTALMWAAFNGDEPLIKLLLARGARINDFTVGGGALAQAAWGGHVGAARLLLDAGAAVDQRDLVANYTPLHWAASSERSSPALVELLLARGGDANAEGGQPVDNFLGATETPLSLARKRGDTPIVQALLKGGAQEVARSVGGSKPTLRPVAGTRTGVEGIQRALAPLVRTAEESVPTYLRHASRQDCVSCHQQQLPLAAMHLAESRGLFVDRQVIRHQTDLVVRSFSAGHIRHGEESHNILEMDWQTTFHPEPAIFDGYVGLDLKLGRQTDVEVTASMVHQLATIQHPDGHWSWNLPRPPIQASDITATAWAVQVLQEFGLPGRRRELESRVRQARSWLARAEAETNEERVHQLLGLAWAGGKSSLLRTLSRELIQQQRPDGGWSQLAGLGSDAYATGQSLYALMEGGRVSAGDPAVRRGLDYLLRTQLADGTWHVKSRAHPFQPPMDSGFPHGRDGWISAAGTSWAVMALATAVDPAQAPPASPMPAQTVTTPPPTPAVDVAQIPSPVEFKRDIQPLLERSCVACHAGERPKGGFDITAREALLRGGARGEPVVHPGKPEISPLLPVVQGRIEDLEMPPLSKRDRFPGLTREEVAKLSAWIGQGAPWPEDARLAIPAR